MVPLAVAKEPAWTPEEFLYTPKDIRNMRERLRREPADGPLHQMVNRGNRWLALLAQPGYLEKLLPAGQPVHGGYPAGACPACGKRLRWQGRSDGRLECSGCKMVFPNAKHPDTETMDLAGRVYRYARDKAGNACNRSAHARYWQTIWTMKHDRPHQYLAIAYLLTDDNRYARAAADVIVRYSQIWLRWPMLRLRRDATGLPRPVTLDLMRKQPSYYGKLQWLDDSILLNYVAFAYGAMRNSGVLTEEEHAVIRDCARETLQLNTFPHLYYRSRSFGNMHGVMYTAMIMAGRAFGRDIVCRDVLFNSFQLNGVDLVHEAYDGPKGLLYACANECDREGSHREASPSYYYMMAGMFLQGLVLARDYHEPAGYAPLAKVAAYYKKGRITFDPGREARIHRLLGYYGIANSKLAMPSLNDSSAGLKISWQTFLTYYLLSGNDESKAAVRALQPKPATHGGYSVHFYPLLKGTDYRAIWRPDTTPRFSLFTGIKDNVGLAVLRGAGNTDLYLGWDGIFASHIQMEQLGLLLYADGRETLMDFGYQGSGYWLRSRWTNRTIAHNTVTVNESVNYSVPRGRLEHWAEADGLRVVQASDQRAFPGLQRFRRTIALIDIDPQSAYCLDVFDVKGGKTHDQSWIVNGTLKRLDGVQLTPRKGTLLGENTSYKDIRPVKIAYTGEFGNGYGFVHKLAAGPCTARTWTAEWEIENSPLKLRILGAASPDDTLTRGSCPFERIPPKRRTAANNDEGKLGPIVIVRRAVRGKTAALSSCLTAAIEPYTTAPAVADVRRIDSDGEKGIEAHLGKGGRRRDTLLVADNGAVTCISRVRGKLRRLLLAGKRRWKGNGWDISFHEPHPPAGTILAVNGENLSLLLDSPLPTGKALKGHLIRTTKNSGLRSHFLIAEVRPEGKGCRVFVDQAGGTFAKHLGLVDEVVDARTFISGTYFTASASWGQIYVGDSILIRDRAYPVAKVEYLGWKKRRRMKISLATDAFRGKSKQGEPFVLSAVAPGEKWLVEMPLSVIRRDDGTYRVRCAAKVSVKTPPGGKVVFQEGEQ